MNMRLIVAVASILFSYPSIAGELFYEGHVDRIVAQCFVGDQDIAMAMICSGDAKDWPKFSGGYYAVCKR